MFNVSNGGITGTVADPRLIFIAALKANAVALVLCHNHPSGSLNPSTADRELTRKMAQAGSLLEIKVLDHLILSSESYYSFADEGLL
jgi:DNA repair protein RadC